MDNEPIPPNETKEERKKRLNRLRQRKFNANLRENDPERYKALNREKAKATRARANSAVVALKTIKMILLICSPPSRRKTMRMVPPVGKASTP